MSHNLLRLSILCATVCCLAACGGKTQEPNGSEVCTSWAKDQALHVGKAENAGQVAASVLADDSTLVVLKNQWPNGGCRVMESRGDTWIDSGVEYLTSCLQATKGRDGTISVLAQNGTDTFVLLERRAGQHAWANVPLPSDTVPTATIKDSTVSYLLGEVSLLSLNGSGGNTTVFALTDAGWTKETIELQRAFKLVSFGYLDGGLAAVGETTDEQGAKRALILTKGTDGWKANASPDGAPSLYSLIGRGSEALTVARGADGLANVFYSQDSGKTWSALPAQGTKASVGLLLEDGVMLAQTPDSPNGSLWISGREPVQFTRIIHGATLDSTTPDGVVGIPLNVAQTAQGYVLTTTQGVYHSDCR